MSHRVGSKLSQQILANLGFSDWDQYEHFWARRNVDEQGNFREPDGEEMAYRKSLIERAASGEKIDLGAIVEEASNEVEKPEAPTAPATPAVVELPWEPTP
jgi:hypothetical protein